MVVILESTVDSTGSFLDRILPVAKKFGGQRRTLPQADISRDARKLARTFYHLDKKKYHRHWCMCVFIFLYLKHRYCYSPGLHTYRVSVLRT